MNVVIIGGITAGLSAASQIRRQAPRSHVVILEKSGDVSYAACGMPYNLFYPDTPVEELYALSLETIRQERGIDYRLNQEVILIDPLRQEVAVRDLAGRREYRESYDSLVYATGSRPNRVTTPGFEGEELFYFRTLADARRVKRFIREAGGHDRFRYTNLEVADVLYNGMTVFELAELDLSYAPPYAPVWDQILVAANLAIKQL